MTLPIRLRLTLWYAALLAIVLIAFSGIVYVVMANTLLRNLDTDLRTSATHVASVSREQNGLLHFPQGEEATDDPGPPPVLISLSGTRSGASIPRSIGHWLAKNPPGSSHASVIATVGNARVVLWPVVRNGRLIGHVLLWDSLQPVEDARQALLLLFLGVGPALLFTAGLGGYLLARRALRPVTHVTEVAAAISATDLQGHVPVSPARDELSALAATFNAMIDRLRSGVERERRFAADASHELRSPLAVIRAETTLALDRTRAPAEYQRVLQVVDNQAEVMEDLVAGLLILARTETLQQGQRASVSAQSIIAEAIAHTHLLALAPAIRLKEDIAPDLTVEGSPSLLVRAVRNLIDNAVKVSCPGGTIRLRAYRAGANAVIQVEDDGPGIAPEHLEHIFEPFYQVSAARTPGDSHGLGLAICKRVVTAHGGRVEVESQPGHGATFRIMLPVDERAALPI